ncbi:MAG: cytochrome P450, partial [Novosphingobium sp.]
EPSFIIRGLQAMHLKLTPAEGFTGVKEQDLGLTAAPQKGSLGLSTAKTRLADLLANEDAKALLDKHFPGTSSDKRIGLAKGMTLRAIQKFAANQFPDDKLDALDADLATL